MCRDHKEEPLKEFLNVSELSGYLEIKKSSLYSMVERKSIPFYRIGHLLRFKKSDIDAWMDGLKYDPKAPQPSARIIARNSSRKPGIHGAKRSIAEAGNPQYNFSCGKPDQVQDLGKEETNGAL